MTLNIPISIQPKKFVFSVSFSSSSSHLIRHHYTNERHNGLHRKTKLSSEKQCQPALGDKTNDFMKKNEFDLILSRETVL